MLTAIFTLALVQHAAPASRPAPAAAGTYVVTFCDSECTEKDTSRVLARGVVVLESPSPSVASAGDDLPGCFHIEKRKSVYGYLALRSPARTTWWLVPGDSIGFLTYRTPDASHVVLAHLGVDGFRGTGSSDGEGIAEIDVADEFVIGRRTGPPDVRQCQLSRDPPAGR